MSDPRDPGTWRGTTVAPTLPRLEVVGERAWFRDRLGARWRVADVRHDETPRVYRLPPDLAATHRVFRRTDGLRCRVALAELRPWYAYLGSEDGTPSALSIALERALDATAGAREWLARGGPPRGALPKTEGR